MCKDERPGCFDTDESFEIGQYLLHIVAMIRAGHGLSVKAARLPYIRVLEVGFPCPPRLFNVVASNGPSLCLTFKARGVVGAISIGKYAVVVGTSAQTSRSSGSTVALPANIHNCILKKKRKLLRMERECGKGTPQGESQP